MIVRRTIKHDSVVAGGGAIEMELSKLLRDYSRTIAGKEQLLIAAIAKGLEIIPRQLCDNAGFDATNILNKLRQKHAQGKCPKLLLNLLFLANSGFHNSYLFKSIYRYFKLFISNDVRFLNR